MTETLDEMERRHKRERMILAYRLAKEGDGPAKTEKQMGDMRVQTRYVARKYGIPVSELVGPRKHRVYNQPRREVWARLKAKGYSLKQIGAYYNRHHTSILHGLQQWEKSNASMG